MKVNLVSFANPNGVLIPIRAEFEKMGYSVSTVVSTPTKSENHSYITYSKLFYFIYRIVFKLIRISKILPYYKIRHLQERVYEAVMKKHFTEPSIIVTTNGWVPNIIKKNKDLGGINVQLAGNPCDMEIAKVLDVVRPNFGGTNDIYSFKPRMTRFESQLFNLSKVVTFNEYSRQSFLPYIDADKIIALSGIWNTHFPHLKDESVVKGSLFSFCYVAHTTMLKGLDVLLKAWTVINNNNVELNIAGSIQHELSPYFRQKIDELPNVNYLGKVKDINQFYRQNYVFICPSIIDAGPMTIVEAMYCGIPVVSSENCGNSYLIDNYKNGIVYPKNDFTALSAAIDFFADNIDDYTIYSKAAIQTAQTAISTNDLFTNLPNKIL